MTQGPHRIKQGPDGMNQGPDGIGNGVMTANRRKTIVTPCTMRALDLRDLDLPALDLGAGLHRHFTAAMSSGE